MMLKVKDNRTIPKENFKQIPKLTERIANKTLKKLEEDGIFVFPQLLADAEDIEGDQFILRGENDNYKTSNVMGFLGLEEERLIIESRFSKGEHDYLFQYLLEQALMFPNLLNLNTNANQETKSFELFIFLFPHFLKNAMRKGIFKTYIRKQYNDSDVKGTIEIARHIKLNTPFIGKIAYSQREFSYDNYLMELIRHTIEFIKKKPYGQQLLKKASEEVTAVVEVTQNYRYYDRRKIITENKKQPVRHAYYHEYRTLQRLCLMILQYEKHGIGSGSNQIHGILFDGAWLWEEYINTLIGEQFYHPLNKGGTGAQQLFSKSTGKIGLIYPDFISHAKMPRVIADAKYKPIQNIGNKDYLQVLAYMFRFDATIGYYLYPEDNDAIMEEFKLNTGTSYEKNVVPREDIIVRKLGLKIPYEVENYEEFVQIMLSNEKQFKEQLSDAYKHMLIELE